MELDNWGTEGAVGESHKTACYAVRVDIIASNVVPVINSRGDRLGYVTGIIKSRDDFDGD